MIGLTGKQFRLYDYIRGYIDQHRIAPTFEEMRSALALSSRSEVHRLLNAMHERGAIRRVPNRARAIELLGPEDRKPLVPLPPINIPTMDSRALMGLRAEIDFELKRRRTA